MVTNPPCNARDTGSVPGWETKIPHAAEQLSPHATTTKLVCHNWGICVPQQKIPHATAKT